MAIGNFEEQNKPTWLLVASALILLIILGVSGFFLFTSKKGSSFVAPVVKDIEKPTPEVKLISWQDQAGFKFSYPQDLAIDPHEEDDVNYAHLELTSPDHEGKMLIWVKDTRYQKIEEWVEDETDKGQVFDAQIGGKEAKKVFYSTPQKIALATIDVDALVLIEVFPDPKKIGYWQRILDVVVHDFEFIPVGAETGEVGDIEPVPPADTGDSGQVIELPEEVIE